MEPFDQDRLLTLLDQNRATIHSQPGVARTSVSLGRGGSPVIKVLYDRGAFTDEGRRAITAAMPAAPIEFEERDPNEVIRPQ
jgi:hypothetical protein